MALDVATPEDSVLKNTTAGKKFWKPQVEDFVVTSPVNNKPVTVPADGVAGSAAMTASASSRQTAGM